MKQNVAWSRMSPVFDKEPILLQRIEHLLSQDGTPPTSLSDGPARLLRTLIPKSMPLKKPFQILATYECPKQIQTESLTFSHFAPHVWFSFELVFGCEKSKQITCTMIRLP